MAQKFVVKVDKKEAEGMLEDLIKQLEFFFPTYTKTPSGYKVLGFLDNNSTFTLYYYPNSRFYLTVNNNTIEVVPE